MLYEFDGRTPAVSADAYVSELATVIGDVVIAENCYIGHGTILRGDYGKQLYIDLAAKYLRTGLRCLPANKTVKLQRKTP